MSDEQPSASLAPDAPVTAPVTALDPAALALSEKPKGPRFEELGLAPHVLKAVLDMGFEYATPVQAATLPLARLGKDLMVQSRTGSGKTAAFGLPFVNDLVDPNVKAVQAIVLLPTRELALQVASELARLAAGSALTVVPVYGGAPMGRQIELLRAGSQIVCGTPGRILDHLRRGTLSLDKVRCAVLDECDEMLSMGFQEDIENILEHTPESRQTLLFSATVPEGIQRLARRFLKKPEILKLSADNIGVQEIRHVYYAIPGISREQELLRILKFENPKSAIIFCNTREETGRVAEFLRGQGFEAEAISSDLSQSDRERVMARMRAGSLHFLVATDVAARGIDIERLSHVFNYTFPEVPELYIHRTGRTGRAGRHGTAISLIGPTEVGSFYYLKLAYKLKPEERALPSETEIRSRREGEHLTQLRKTLPPAPGNEWRSLARRLMVAADAEHLIAGLIARVLGTPQLENATTRVRRDNDVLGSEHRKGPSPSAHAHRGPALEERAALSHGEPSGTVETREDLPATLPGDLAVPAGRTERTDGDRTGGERSRAPRPERKDRFSERGGERTGGRLRDDRPGRPGERDRRGPGRLPPERAAVDRVATDRPATVVDRAVVDRPVVDRPVIDRPVIDRAVIDRPVIDRPVVDRPVARPAVEPRKEGSGDREFWDVWKDEAAPAPQAESSPRETPEGEPAAEAGMGPGSDLARLYINLGRKDGAGENEIRDLLRAHADFDDVRSIEVMNTHTYLNVPMAHADAIVQAVAGKTVGDRDIICEKAKPRRR